MLFRLTVLKQSYCLFIFQEQLSIHILKAQQHLFTLHPADCPSPGAPSNNSFPYTSLPYSSERVSLGIFPTLEHQVSAGLGASAPTEARQDSPARRTYDTENSFWYSPCSICLRPTLGPRCTFAIYVQGGVEVIGLACVCSLAADSVSESPKSSD